MNLFRFFYHPLQEIHLSIFPTQYAPSHRDLEILLRSHVYDGLFLKHGQNEPLRSDGLNADDHVYIVDDHVHEIYDVNELNYGYVNDCEYGYDNEMD